MQSSVAVSANGASWVLINASPDVRHQLVAHPALWPPGLRDSPIAAVALTDGELDHTAGLTILREGVQRLAVYAPDAVIALLHDHWPVLRLLGHYAGVDGRPWPKDGVVTLANAAGQGIGLRCRAVALAHRPPRYAPGAPVGTYTVGLRLDDPRTGGTFAYIPSAAAVDSSVRSLAQGVDLLCFDGTFWSNNELGAVGVDAPTQRAMGHLPIGGRDGSLAALPQLGAKRTVLVHLNNTNPVLDPASPQRAELEAAQIEVGDDGMEFEV
jgi:pyrroloquinoline quinone biosynthesis protein B